MDGYEANRDAIKSALELAERSLRFTPKDTEWIASSLASAGIGPRPDMPWQDREWSKSFILKRDTIIAAMERGGEENPWKLLRSFASAIQYREKTYWKKRYKRESGETS